MSDGTDAAETVAPTAETEESTTDETAEKSEVDWKSRSREWEKRAKANADAATRLAEFEESQKSEAQKLVERAEVAEQAASVATADALRWKIAAAHGVSDDDAELFLTGTDEETLTRQAERLAARTAEEAAPRAPRPDPNQGGGPKGDSSTADQFASAVGGFFNS